MNEIPVITLSVRTINLLISILLPVALGWHSFVLMSSAVAMQFPLTNKYALWKSFPSTELIKHRGCFHKLFCFSYPKWG